MQEKIPGEFIFARIHVGPVFALGQIQENLFEELLSKHVFAPLQICIRTFAPSLCMDTVAVFTHPDANTYKYFWGINFGANACGACIRTPANTEKYFWRVIYVLVSCQGVIR